MPGKGDPPPEAVIIRRARQARALSPEDAAPRTGVIKSRRWRQIEAGVDGGKRVRAEDDVLAHMASVVDVAPDQLDSAGRPEASEILREILRQRAGEEAAAHDQGIPPLSPELLAEVQRYIRFRLSDGEQQRSA
jgi:hypothetical protein